jgi:hypothetical protein
MLKKDDKSQQLVYYQVRGHEPSLLEHVTDRRGPIGWHRDIYYSRNRYTSCGKMEKDRRYGYRDLPRCTRYGCVVIVDSDYTWSTYGYTYRRRI